MAEQQQKASPALKYGIIIGVIILIVLAVLALAFIFFLPTWFPPEGATEDTLPPPDFNEIIMRIAIVIVVIIVALVFVAGIVFMIYEWFFKKRELHIVKEYQQIAKQAAMLNPVETMRNLKLTGKHQVQSYDLGKIVGHTQVPLKFQRLVHLDENGEVDENRSEKIKVFNSRVEKAKKEGRHVYDFFAFITQRGIYALPFFSMLEPPKLFACYPAERSPDLLGDVEIYDVGTWKVSGVNLFIPAQRSQEPDITINEVKSQLMPIAYMSLIDYLGLIAQRGIEGDVSMQKWLQAKATMVNVKEGTG